MLPDRVSNPGPLTYESGALPIALRGPAPYMSLFRLLFETGCGSIESVLTIAFSLLIFFLSKLNNAW